jgi:hypothetical protein
MPVLALILVMTTPHLQEAVQAHAVKVGAAAQVAQIDTGELKGDPAKLAWSPDASELYLQTVEMRGSTRNERHYVLRASGGDVKRVDTMPEWAGKYWAWKSGQAAPGVPAFKIALSDEQKTIRATAAPMGGDLARGGTSSEMGTTLGDATAASAQSQVMRVITLKLHGETIGEFVNGPLVPGLTFGWSPADLALVAYTTREGKLVVMDQKGGKNEVPGTSDALLPAWSDDGTKIAFLKRDGRRQFAVLVAGVTR